MINASILLEKVYFERDSKLILQSIDLNCSADRIGIVGANGSGKSTLAKLFMGLEKPSKGLVRIHGVDVWKDRKDALKTIGMIFQNPDHQIIFPTCLEEMAFGLTQMGVNKTSANKQAQDMLNRFDRAEWASRSTQALSQGQRHFLCLMAILIMEPKVLVLDEPYAGLDIPTSMRLHRSLHNLEQQIIMITHDLDILKDYDHIVWIDDGQIVTQGPSNEILPEYKQVMHARGALDA